MNQKGKKKAFNSLLFVLKERKGMGNDFKNQLYLAWIQKRKVHTHTHSPQDPMPSLDVLPTSGSISKGGLVMEKAQKPLTDKRELTSSNHFQARFI